MSEVSVSFPNYTAAAQTSLIKATREAEALQHLQVEPEHVLMALLTPESGPAWSVLSATVGNPLSLRESVQLSLLDAATGALAISPATSYRTNRALSEAQNEARRAQSQQVDTPHLLLGLMDEGGAAAQILRRSGLDVTRLRQWVRQPNFGLPAQTPRVQPPKPAQIARDKRLAELEDKSLKYALPRLISWPAVFLMLSVLIGGGVLATQNNFNVSRAGVVVFVLMGWIISLCAHEFAHALVADLGGDHSVRLNGYLSFNPLKYTHPVLSIVLPLMFVLMGGIGLPGGAVYVNHSRLRNSRWESAVSFAGPAASALMTLLFALPFWLHPNTPVSPLAASALWDALGMMVMLNCAAVLFNLLPIPPLDGFGVIAPYLAPSLRVTLYSFGTFGILLIFMLLSFNQQANQLFWQIVDNMMLTLNVPPIFAGYGLALFMFWR